MSSTDLRQTLRASVVWRGGIIFGPGNYQMIKVTDVSEGGLAFLCPRNFPVGQRLRLGIEIPAPDNPGKRHQCLCDVSVIHAILSHADYKIGVRFLDIENDHRSLIKTWVHKHIMPTG